MHRLVRVGVLLSLLGAVFADRAAGADYFWLGGDGVFGNENKWQDYADPNHHKIPGPSDSAYTFSSNTAYTVFFDGDYRINYGVVAGTTGSLYFSGNSGSLAAIDFRVGDYDGGGNSALADKSTLLVYGNPLLPLNHLQSTFLTVGGGGTGTLWLYGSGRFKSTKRDDGYGIVTIGNAQSGVGTIYVTDPGSQLDAGGNDVVVGNFGRGTLALYNGGHVTAVRELLIGAQSGNVNSNAVNVVDPGSLLEADTIYAGEHGKGELGVYAGGKVKITDIGGTGGSLYIGRVAGADGTVNLTDAGTLLDASGPAQAVFVGASGAGTMLLHDGAQADANYVFIGSQSGGQGNFHLYANSLLTVNQLNVGYSGTGSLTIDSGAMAKIGVLLDVGVQNSGVGNVTVSGASSMLDALNHDISIGIAGTGSLNIAAGGQLINAGILSVGGGANAHNNSIVLTGAGSAAHSSNLSVGFNNSVGDSTVTIADSAHLFVTNSITLGSRATLDTTGGAVDATDTGPSAAVGNLRVGIHGTLTGIGRVVGNVVSAEAGRIIPGSALGTLTIDGNFTQTTGQLFFTLNGSTPAQYSRLNITGNATFGGVLNVQKASSFIPSAGDTFDLLDFVASSGTFSTITLPTLASGMSWSTSQLYSAGIIRVVSLATLLGDFNFDKHVDAADIPAMLAALTDLNTFKARNGLGESDLASIGDIDGSGSVNNADINALIGLLRSGGGSLAAVPEPTSIVLMVLALPGIAFAAVRRSGRANRSMVWSGANEHRATAAGQCHQLIRE